MSPEAFNEELPPAANEQQGEEVKLEEKIQPFYEYAKLVRAGLQVTESDDVWKKHMEMVMDLPKPPESSKVGAAQMQVLTTEYENLVFKRRVPLQEGLNLLVTRVKDRNGVPETLRLGVMRELAQYIDLRRRYDQLWTGVPGAPQKIEPYFAPFVENTEREKMALSGASVLFRFQYDVLDDAGVDNSPIKLSKSTTQIALDAIRSRLLMSDIYACVEGDAVSRDRAKYEAFFKKLGYGDRKIDDEEVDAAKLLIGFLRKNKKSIELQARLRTGGDVNSLSVADALEATTGLPGAQMITGEIIENIRGINLTGPPDLRAFANHLFDDMQFGERAKETILGPLAELADKPTPEESQSFQANAKEVSKFCLEGTGAIIATKEVENHYGHLNGAQKKMVQKLVVNTTSPDMTKKLLSAVHIEPNPADLTGFPKTVADALADILEKKNVTMREAFELHYLANSENNFLMLSYKVVDLLNDHGYPRIAQELQYKVFRDYVDVIASHSDDIDQIATDLKLSPEQARELDNFRRYMQENGVDVATGLWDRIVDFHKYFPEIAYPLDLIGATPLGILGWKAWVKLRWNRVVEFSEMNPTQLEAWAKKNGVDLERAKAAQVAVKDLVTKRTNMALKSDIVRLPPRPWRAVVRGARLLGQAGDIIRSVNADELAEMAKALKGSELATNIDDVTRRLCKVSNDPNVIARALYIAGYDKAEITSSVKKMRTEMIEAMRRSATPLGISDADLANVTAMAVEVDVNPKTFSDVDEERAGKRGKKRGGGRR